MRIAISAPLLAALLGLSLPAAAAGGPAGPDMCASPPCSKAEIAAYEHRVSQHVLRSLQRRFAAVAEGDAKRVHRFNREVARGNARQLEARRALTTAHD